MSAAASPSHHPAAHVRDAKPRLDVGRKPRKMQDVEEATLRRSVPIRTRAGSGEECLPRELSEKQPGTLGSCLGTPGRACSREYTAS